MPQSAVRLRKSTTDTFFHRAFELLLGRFHRFKNRPRCNYLVLRAAWLVAIFGVAGVVAAAMWSWIGGLTWTVHWKVALAQPGVAVRAIVTGLGAFATVFWQLNRMYSRQWNYCNEAYIEFLKSEGPAAKRLGNALAHDVLVCDMWANRSLGEHFRTELRKAIRGVPAVQYKVQGELARLDAGDLTEDEAAKYLSEYEKILLGSDENPSPDRPSNGSNGTGGNTKGKDGMPSHPPAAPGSDA